MARFLKLLVVVIIVAAVAGSSAYVVLFADLGGGDGSSKDTTAPVISFITGNTTGATGKSTLIEAAFSDNGSGVSSATLFYRRSGDSSFSQVNFLNQSYSLKIPSGLATNYEYYVTVDDVAGNTVRDPVNESDYYLITVSQENVSLVHTVFVEEGTAKWCVNCPAIAKILHELEGDSSLHFMYVSLIEDYSDAAYKRVHDDYRIYGFPTLYIDGGFQNPLVGADKTTDQVKTAIKQAMDRPVPDVEIKVSALYDNTTNKTSANVTLTNFGAKSYAGTLRVYLNERVSEKTADGITPYYHGFLEFLDNEKITVAPGKVFTKNLPIDISGHDVENLEVTAAAFNASGTAKDSNYANFSTLPPNSVNRFTAYYADAVNTTVIVPGGNLPPTVGITFPQPYSVNIFNKRHFEKLLDTLYFFKPKVPLCIGHCTIIANATDDSKVAKVVFYFDGNEVANFTQAPYEWKMKGVRPYLPLKKHEIKVTAFDDSGKSTSTSISVRLLRL